jgi:DHA1 family bicyclomycin/chloramphenicol resistance-like MFS transporter
MLEQQSTDTGSAVALIQFFSMMCGSAGMILVSLRPEALIDNLGFIQLAIGLIGLGSWLMLRNKSFVVSNLPDREVPVEHSAS